MTRPRPLAAPLLLPALFSALLSISCQKPATVEAPGAGLEWSASEPRVFVVGADGLEPLRGGAVAGTSGARLATAARVAGVAAFEGEASEARGAAVVIEGWGLARVEALSGGSRLRLLQERLPSLEGLRVGGFWPRKRALIAQLYRDPFSQGGGEGGAPSSHPAGIFLLDDAGAFAIVPSFFSDFTGRGFELFALLPDPRMRGAWLIQFRSSSGATVKSEYLSFPNLEASKATRITRGAFEAALAPAAVSSAPAALRAALDGLRAFDPGLAPSAIIRYADSSGASRWYSYGDDPSSSRELQAWSDGKGAFALLSPTGRGTLGDGSGTRSFTLEPPLAGSWFTGLGFFGLGGKAVLLIVSTWEMSGTDGPLSGILVETLPPP